MSTPEDLDMYLSVFGASCTLAGAAVTAMVEGHAVLEFDGVVTQAPAAVVRTSAAAGAAPGQAFVDDTGTAYSVRQVLKLPPDGAFARLVLARE